MEEIEIALLRGIAEGLKCTVQGFAAQPINEAADEIERLRKQVAQLSEEYEKLAGERGPH